MPLNYFLLLCLLATTNAMFADEVGVRDWLLKHVGKVTHASYKHREMFGATESGALFKVLSRTGRVAWRQVLPAGETTDVLLLNKQTLFTVSAATGHAYMWQATDGALLWDRHLPTSAPSAAAAASASASASASAPCQGKYVPVDMDDDGLDDVVVLANNAVTLLSSGGSGQPFWEYRPASDSERVVLIHVGDEGEHMYVVGVDEAHNKVLLHTVALTTGVEAHSHTILGAPVARGGAHGSGMVLTESGAQTYVVWTTTSAVSSSSEVQVLAANVADGTKMLFPAAQALPDALGQALQDQGAALTLAATSLDASRPGVAPFVGYEISTVADAFPGVNSVHGVFTVVHGSDDESTAAGATAGATAGALRLHPVATYATPAARSFSYGVAGGGTATTGAARGSDGSTQALAFPVVVERLAASTSVRMVVWLCANTVVLFTALPDGVCFSRSFFVGERLTY